MLETVARVELGLETPKITLVVGEKVTQKITLRNLTPLPDLFTLSVEGIPASWCNFDRNNLNMFPNWQEAVVLEITTPPKARANRYRGQIVVAARNQPSVRARVNLELEVLAPLELSTGLYPRRAKGFKAGYALKLHNRTVVDAVVPIHLKNDNPFCIAQLPANQVSVLAGQTQLIKFKLQLKPKAPPDQASQTQDFALALQPQWQVGVGTGLLPSPELTVSGQYIPQSRWVWFKNHPRLFIVLGVLLLLVLLWSILIVPLIREGLLGIATQKASFQGAATSPLQAEQTSFNNTIQTSLNPVGALVQLHLEFTEPAQSIVINLKSWLFSADMRGKLEVVAETGDLVFKADNPQQLNSFPWFFLPPDQLVQRLNPKLKAWPAGQNQRLDKAEIEGHTLFLRLKACVSGEVACKRS